MEVILLLLVVFFGLAALGAVVKLVLGLALQVVLLPFKILGLLFKVISGAFGVVAKVLFSTMGLVVALVGTVLLLVVIPLVPFLLVGGLVWLVLRRPRTHPVLRHSA